MGKEKRGTGGLVYGDRGGSAVESHFARVLSAAFESRKTGEGGIGGVHAQAFVILNAMVKKGNNLVPNLRPP